MRPRSVTLACTLTVFQTVLWIAALLLPLLYVQAMLAGVREAPIGGWAAAITAWTWERLKWRLLEGAAVVVLAILTFKRFRWARRALEIAVIVRAVMPLPRAAVLVEFGPSFWGMLPFPPAWITTVFASLILLTGLAPFLVWLLETRETREWFRAESERGYRSAHSG